MDSAGKLKRKVRGFLVKTAGDQDPPLLSSLMESSVLQPSMEGINSLISHLILITLRLLPDLPNLAKAQQRKVDTLEGST